MAELPNRINCQQDEEDVYEHFAREANAYVLARIPFEKAQNHQRRFFISANSLRYVTDYQLEQMQRLTGSSYPNVIPMQSVLNDLNGALQCLANVREKLGLPKAEWRNGPWERLINGYERGLDDAIEILKDKP